MQWFRSPKQRMMEAGRLARLVHSRWLSDAIAGRMDPPRIPTRKVSEGGFSRMLGRPGGRERAERWWDLALERVPGE